MHPSVRPSVHPSIHPLTFCSVAESYPDVQLEHASWARLGVLGKSNQMLGAPFLGAAFLGRAWAFLDDPGHSWAFLGGLWALGAVLERSARGLGAVLARSWGVLGAS